MQKTVLAYGFDKNSEKYLTILELAKEFDIDVVEVYEEQLGEKVGFLMGLAEYEKKEEKKSYNKDIEFLLFSDMDRRDLSNYLVALKRKGVSVPHKSVLTKMTKDWDFIELLDHIEVEHRVMQKFNILGTMVKEAREKLEKEENKALEKAIESALELTKMKDITEKDVDEKFEAFKGLL